MKFHAAVIVSVIGPRLLCQMDDIYKILNYITQENLYTHQLGRAARAVAPVLSVMYPDLADLAKKAETEVTTANYREWLAAHLKDDDVRLVPDTIENYDSREPVSELIEIMSRKGRMVPADIAEHIDELEDVIRPAIISEADKRRPGNEEGPLTDETKSMLDSGIRDILGGDVDAL